MWASPWWPIQIPHGIWVGWHMPMVAHSNPISIPHWPIKIPSGSHVGSGWSTVGPDAHLGPDQMASRQISWASPWKSHMGFPWASVGTVLLTVWERFWGYLDAPKYDNGFPRKWAYLLHYTLPQNKRNFNFRIFYGDPGSGSVTLGYVNQGKCSWKWKCCITPDFPTYTLPKKRGKFQTCWSHQVLLNFSNDLYSDVLWVCEDGEEFRYPWSCITKAA